MNTSWKRELPSLVLVALPFIYLAYIWNKLPEKVPVHWDIHGEVDRYGSKWELLLIPFLLPLLVYLIFTIVPRVDPKKQIHKMGGKYQQLKFGLTLAMSLLALVILYNSYNPGVLGSNVILAVVGIMFMIMGNYMKTLKWNYFIGIRTPWTLEYPSIWQETHKIGGIVMFVGGLLILLASWLLSFEHAMILVVVTSLGMALGMVIFSYYRFTQLDRQG